MIAQLPKCGTVFEAKYRLDAVLGEGGFARVYQAADLKVGRNVAIKILKPTNDPRFEQAAARFDREMRIVAQLTSPNVAKLFDHGHSDSGLQYMVFELVPGADLTHLLMRGRLGEAEAIHVLEQLLHALREAHAAGLLHRDVKPANIRVYQYMDDPLCVKLLDFGIAKSITDDAGLTSTGMVVGTPRFMAPEQLWGEPLHPSSDLYGVALVIYELLRGRPSDHVKLIANGDIVQLRHEDGVSADLAAIINRMLAVEPVDRYPDADAVFRALEQLRRARSGHQGAAVSASARSSEGSRASSRSKPRAPVGLLGSPIFVAALGFVSATSLGAIWIVVSEPVPAPQVHTVPPVQAVRAVPVAPAATIDAARQLDAEPVEAAPPGGCERTDPFVGTRTLSAESGLDRQEWLVHVPRTYQPHRPHPAVVLLHDDVSSGAKILHATGLAALAEEHSFIIVAPSDRFVAGTLVWQDDDDYERIETAVAGTRDTLCIDTERIFAVGHGTGAEAAERLSCANWVKGVAIASHIPTKPRFPCDAAPAVPAIWFGPTRTGYQPVDGGTASDCPLAFPKISYDAYEQMWRTRNATSQDGKRWFEYKGSVCTEFEADGAPFVSCRTDGGRGWPGSAARDTDILGCDGEPPEFPQSEVTWRFLNSIGSDDG